MAAELILVLRDFFAVTDEEAPSDEPRSETDRRRLPALETLLAKGRDRELPEGWRAHLGERFGSASFAELSPAAAVAAAWLDLPAASSPASHYWLATPVHYFAGLDSVHLHPAGLLDLTLEAQAALASDFNAVFADSRWRLHATGRRELLLEGPPLAADGEDPARFLGCKLGYEQTRGADADGLRRLAVEIEMWLHEHAVNRQRQAIDELPVSGLWLWGWSRPVPHRIQAARPERAGSALRLYGQDIVAETLWRGCGGECLPLPARLAAALENPATVYLIVFPTACMEGTARALERFEAQWLTPGLTALRAGVLDAVELLAGTHEHRLRRLDLARFWRARAPWQEAMT